MPDLGNSRTQTSDQTYVHANSVAVQQVVEYTILKDYIELSLDLTELTQDTNVVVDEKVDGVTYQQSSFAVYPTDFDSSTGVITIVLNGKGKDMQLTFQSVVLEGATRNIPINTLRTTRQ